MGHHVYKGCDKKGRIVYIGCTIQEPAARFRKHKSDGKDLRFEVISNHETPEEMLAEEFRLIQQHNPKLNRFKHKPHNLNRKLTPEQLQARVGDVEWCQCCLKRRKRPGYKNCSHCRT